MSNILGSRVEDILYVREVRVFFGWEFGVLRFRLHVCFLFFWGGSSGFGRIGWGLGLGFGYVWVWFSETSSVPSPYETMMLGESQERVLNTQPLVPTLQGYPSTLNPKTLKIPKP